MQQTDASTNRVQTMGFIKTGEDPFRKVEDIDKQQREYAKMMLKMRNNTQTDNFETQKVQFLVKIKPEKRFIIDRSSLQTQQIYREICGGGAKEGKKKVAITSLRLNKGALKAFLSHKYRGYVAQRMVSVFDFSN